MPRLARLLLLTCAMLPTLVGDPSGRARPPCAPAGRGTPPRGWLGCAADEGPSRDLTGDERLLLGLPLDLNRATARELGFVPGISAALAAEVAADRARSGPFGSVEELVRVHGIGPRRLSRAAPFLLVPAPTDAVANGAE